MQELFSNIGINWKVLTAQIVNFAILLFILRRFLYKPLIGMLNKRQEEITATHEKANEIEKKFTAFEKEKESQLQTTRKATEEMIKKAEANAVSAAEKIISDAKEEAAKLSKEEGVKISQDREKLIQETKRNLGESIALAIEKTVGDVLDDKAKAKLAEQALSQVKTLK